MSTTSYSVSPSGEQFELPNAQDYQSEFQRMKKLADEHRAAGDEIVVVLGLGFVGAVMAAIIADADGKFVIGKQRPAQGLTHRIVDRQAGRNHGPRPVPEKGVHQILAPTAERSRASGVAAVQDDQRCIRQ